MAKKPVTLDDFLTAEAENGRVGSSGDTRTGTDTGTGPDSDNRHADSDIGSDGEQHGLTGVDGGTIDETGDGSFDLPLGIDDHRPGGKSHRQQTGGDGSARKRRGSRARTDKGRAETQETTASIPDSPPREISYDKLGSSPSDKKSAKNQALTLKFFAETWGLVFTAAAVFTRDTEWKLEDDDAQELAERTESWLGSLDAKRLAAARKRIAKIQPALSLCMALGAITIPRISHTRSMKRAGNLQPKQNGTNPSQTNGTRQAAPVTANPHSMAGEVGERPAANAGGPIEFRGRPIRREDWQDVPDETDS